MKKIIEIKNLSFSYENQQILKDINLEVEENDFMAILGPNGGGKTTLLKLITGLIKPTKGKIFVLGKEPKKVKKYIGYVPHISFLINTFPLAFWKLF